MMNLYFEILINIIKSGLIGSGGGEWRMREVVQFLLFLGFRRQNHFFNIFLILTIKNNIKVTKVIQIELPLPNEKRDITEKVWMSSNNTRIKGRKKSHFAWQFPFSKSERERLIESFFLSLIFIFRLEHIHNDPGKNHSIRIEKFTGTTDC